MKNATRWLSVLLMTYVAVIESSSSYTYHHGQPVLHGSDAIPAFFTVADFHADIDGSLNASELQDLLGCNKGAYLTREQFLLGIERVKQKQSVSLIATTFQTTQQGIVVSCAVVCDWILRSLKVTGILSGKEEYAYYYEIQVGDPFIMERHSHSLEELKKYLGNIGYKSAMVTDAVSYDQTSKTVAVTIHIKQNKPFLIHNLILKSIDPQVVFSESDKQAVMKKINSLQKKVCQGQKIDVVCEHIKKFLLQQGYRNPLVEVQQKVDCDRHTVDLLFCVTVHEKKKPVFFGNHFFTDKELEKKVAECALEHIVLPGLVAAQELENQYYKKGFWNVRVTCSESRNEELFVIYEGRRCSIKKVCLRGVTVLDPRWLEREFFTSIIQAPFYDEEKIEMVNNSFMEWYKKEGFWDAKIIKKEYTPMEGVADSYVLLLTIDEGQQRLLVSLKHEGFFENIHDFSMYSLLQLTDKPSPLPATYISLEQQALTKKLRKKGYVYAQVQPVVVQEGGLVGVTWKIEKGPEVRFGKTIFRGHTKIPYERLVAMLPYKQGEKWSKEKAQQTHTFLRSLQTFERVAVQPVFKNGMVEEQDMIITVKDDDPFEVKLRMGFAQVSRNFYFKKGSTYKVGGSFMWKNPLALADVLSIDFDTNRYEQRCNLSYKLPFFFDVPLMTVIKGYSNKYIQPLYIGSSKPLYKVLQQGFLLAFSKKFSKSDLGLTSGFEWMETTDIALNVARAINFDVALVNKKIPYFFIEPMIYVDFLDDKLNPTKGFYGLTSLKGMFPFKESSFMVKWLGEQGVFIPFHILVLAMRVRAGHIFQRRFDAIMPPERFLLGGPFSLRGYYQDYCPPLGSYTDEDGQVQHVPQGGKTMFNANFELRLPFMHNSLWAAAFQDVGILIEDPRPLFTFTAPLLASTGFGLRYMTPIGPLRFDIGWKWHKALASESSYAWFLTFGNAF